MKKPMKDDASVDVVFCHQTFHHLTRQREALREFHRVLKPGGLLLFAESTRAYIESWIIRLLGGACIDHQVTALFFNCLLETFDSFQHARNKIGVIVQRHGHTAIPEASDRFQHGTIEFFGHRLIHPESRRVE